MKSFQHQLRELLVTAGLVTIASAVVGPLLVQASAWGWLTEKIDLFAKNNILLQGGLFRSIGILRTFAATLWSTIAPMLPWIALIGELVAAILLLQDVMVKGWEKSYLGRFVNWLLEKLPFLKLVAENVAKAINWPRQGVDWFTSTIGSFTTQITRTLDTLGPMKYLLHDPAGQKLSRTREIICYIDNLSEFSLISPLLRYFGVRIISHFPCNFKCKESLKIAKK